MNMSVHHTGHHIRAKPKLDEQAFERITNIAYKDAGLDIAPSKMAMVHTRLARRLRTLGLQTYDEYCALIEGPEGQKERRQLISALTTNVSHFFREDHHFERLVEDVLPSLITKLDAGGRVRLWSAGCSNGQEPYTIAMSILEHGNLKKSTDLRILATDIDPNVIQFARQGIYDQRMISGVPDTLRDQYFSLDPGPEPMWRVRSELREMIVFKELNLLHPWPMQGRFDVIFCRNVVIYFDETTQENLWKNFAEVMNPGAWLFLGHSERVCEKYHSMLSPAGMTTYRKSENPPIY